MKILTESTYESLNRYRLESKSKRQTYKISMKQYVDKLAI